LGNNRYDLGIQVTGPVAQDALQVFDDLWEGAHRRHCSDFHPAIDQTWQATCYDLPAKSGHIPEVLRYYLPQGDSIAFSMYRSEKHDEADQQIVNALTSAQQSIDTVQVNFTLEMICDLNIILDVCTFDNALPFMTSMLTAAENGARIRILVKPLPIDGIESVVAIDVFKQVLDERGLDEMVEVRFLVEPMHYKATLIDDDFLIVGSQNFHYSAFGYGLGLTEFSLGVSDPQAIQDFRQLFEFHWERAERQ
jgi:cardiolipin synthase